MYSCAVKAGARIIIFNKPFRVLSQFTDAGGRCTLAEFIADEGFYPAGRLDYDSEGLLVLCEDGAVQHRIASPRFRTVKTYLAQVEGEPDEEALEKLRTGVRLSDGVTLPAEVERIADPGLWPRNPPIRVRANIPTSWLRIRLTEGRNRQVRRMTAAVGYPTLRLVRWSVGPWSLEGLQPGEWRRETLAIHRARNRVRDGASAKRSTRGSRPMRRRL